MIAALLPALASILGDAVKRLCPDAEARQKAEAELNAALPARARENFRKPSAISSRQKRNRNMGSLPWLVCAWNRWGGNAEALGDR